MKTFMDNSGGEINGVRDIAFQPGYLAGGAFDKDYVYVASAYIDEVLRYNTGGTFDSVFVSANSGGIDHPDGLEFGPDANGDGIAELYVTGRLSHSVVRYDGVTGDIVVGGDYGISGSGGLSYPYGLTFRADVLYVTSRGSNQVLKYDAMTGASLGVAASSGLSGPHDGTFGTDGLMCVASIGNDRIVRFQQDGTFVDYFDTAGTIAFDRPHAIAFRSGDLYVTATGSKQILRFSTTPEAVFTVSISSPNSLPVTVDFTTTDGTAKVLDGDYTATSGTVTFAPGATSRTILVSTIDDAITESFETFTVDLANATGATIADATGQGAILDDEAPAVDVPAGLVIWWTADKTADDLMSRNDAVLYNSAAYVPGRVGQAISFDGVDDRMQLADSESLTLTKLLTFETWILVDSFPTSGHGTILFRGDDRGGLDPYNFSVKPGGLVSFGITGPSVSSSLFAPIPQGRFVHVAATLDDDTGAIRLYVNGILADSVVLTDSDTAIFSFGTSPVTTEEIQAIQMAAGSVTRASDGLSRGAFNGTVRNGRLLMEVTATTPSPSNALVLEELSAATTAVASMAGMDGGNGGWSVLYGTNPVSADGVQFVIDEDQLFDSERSHTTEQVAFIAFDGTASGDVGPFLRTATVSDVSNDSWTTVTLSRSYTSMAVIATPNYSNTSPPLVARVRNAVGNSFEVKVERADGLAGTVSGIDIHYTVVEEGVYDGNGRGHIEIHLVWR